VLHALRIRLKPNYEADLQLYESHNIWINECNMLKLHIEAFFIALRSIIDQNTARFDDIELAISPFIGRFRATEWHQTIALE